MSTAIGRYFSKAFRDDLLTQSAALAYYASLSVPALVMLALTAMSLLGWDMSREFIAQTQSLLGDKPAAAVVAVFETAQNYSAYGKFGQVLGTCLLLFSASAVMGQLQVALNHVFGPARGRNAWLTLLMQRLIALAVVLISILLAIASIATSVLLKSVSDPSFAYWATILHTLLSFTLFPLVFSLLFRMVPDCPPKWPACIWGGALTTALFLLGKAPMAMVIEKSVWASLYGAAGTLMLLMIWVYYSSLIICLGAELAYFVGQRTTQEKKHGIPEVRKLRQRLRQGLYHHPHGRVP